MIFLLCRHARVNFAKSWDDFADELKLHDDIKARHQNPEEAAAILRQRVKDLSSEFRVRKFSPDAHPLDMDTLLQWSSVREQVAAEDVIRLCDEDRLLKGLTVLSFSTTDLEPLICCLTI